MEISIELFMELHEKAVKYDLLKKEYEGSAYHISAEKIVFGQGELKLDMLKGGEVNEFV